ncbi:hypothetical protein ACFE04_014468 [Oxalis oulophora]
MGDVDNLETPDTASSKASSTKPAQGTIRSIDTYAAQCEKCFKWRVIDTEEEYEEIRSRNAGNPFACDKKLGVTCKDPGDIEYDATRTWVIDRPGIPKTPGGFKRSLVLRKDFSKMDAYYITPTGKKLKSSREVASFLEANPRFKNVALSDFTFAVPKVAEETIPVGIQKKERGSANGSGKRSRAV